MTRVTNLVFLVLWVPACYGLQRIDGYCEQGNKAVTSIPYPSAPGDKYQASYPGCTVKVTIAGSTTLATIYSDNNNNSKTNPFQADGVGYYYFYADSGRYDVTISGGGMTQPYTLGDQSGPDPYFKAGSGATNRLVADKLGERLSVKDYGAKGDGSTNDTAAFNATLNAALARVGGGATIYMPCGTYVLSSSANQSAMWIQSPKISLAGESESCTVLKYTGAGTAIRIQMNPFTITPAGDYSNFTILGTPTGQIGLQTGSLVSGTFTNIMVEGFRNGTGIALQDRLDLFPNNNGSWTERCTFTNVSGGGLEINNSINWSMEVLGGAVNDSFGYNRFNNIQANTHSSQIGMWIKQGAFFYNSSLTMTCNMDDQLGYSSPGICVQSDGNSDQNYYQITGEYMGTNQAFAVKGSATGRFVGTGTVNVIGAVWNYNGTPGQGPKFRVTAGIDNQTQDAGYYPMTGVGGQNLALPNVGFGDRQGIGNFGVLIGSNIASPFVSMYETFPNKFVVGSLPFNQPISNMHERFTVDSAGNTFVNGRLWVNLTTPSQANASYVADINGGLLVRSCTYSQSAAGAVNIGGCTGTGRAGLYSLFATTTNGINETLGFGDTNWSSGYGTVIGSNIAHPQSWAHAGDTIAYEWYAKPFQVALQTSNRIAWITIGGAMVANGYQTIGGQTGMSITKTVKGSDGNNCTLVFTGGIMTSTTCP